jgi:hypothetical protein
MPTKRKKTRDQLSGFAAECLVLAYATLGAAGRLDAFRPGTDVDHKDILFDEIGGYRNAYLQVKCTTFLQQGIRVQCWARYQPNEIPSDSRFAYVFCFLDRKNMELSRMWLVPSSDFNRLAYRSSYAGGKVALIFSAKASGDPKWDRYEVDKQTLGLRLLEIATAPTKRKTPGRLTLGSSLIVRARLDAAA